jgi:hypothetical protein
VLTKLNLADAWRREALQVRAEELTAEERGEVVEVAEPAPLPPAAPETNDDAPVDEPVEETAAPKPPRKRAPAAKKEEESE